MRMGIRRKAAAILAAGTIALTGISPITASAAYVDMERENWTSFADVYGEMWDKEMEAFREGETSSGELKLELGDFVRSMLGSLFTTTDGGPMDFSWLGNIALQAEASREESNIVATAIAFCLNDTVLATLELPIDFGSDMVKFRVPEISENYLGAPFEFETEEARQQWQRMKEVLNPDFLAELAADGDEVAELLKRYGDILFDHMADAASEEKTETMANLEQTFTVEEGRLYADGLSSAMLEMAKQARDDEQLKEMIENLGTFSQQEDIYEEYQQEMDEAIRDMEDEMPEPGEYGEDNYISSKVWLDAEGECAGREFAFVADGKETAQLAWLNISEDDQEALRLYYVTEEESGVLSGVGTITDGRLNGTYMVTQNGLVQYQIEVSDYDVETEPGDLDGTYKLTYIGETDDSQSLFSLGNFALILDVEEKAQEKINNLSLSLTMNDELIAALHLKEEEGTDLLADSDAGEGILYEADKQEDLQKYAAEVDPEAIFENCRKAGVPDDVIEQVAGFITQMMQAPQQEEQAPQQEEQLPQQEEQLPQQEKQLPQQEEQAPQQEEQLPQQEEQAPQQEEQTPLQGEQL